MSKRPRRTRRLPRKLVELYGLDEDEWLVDHRNSKPKRQCVSPVVEVQCDAGIPLFDDEVLFENIRQQEQEQEQLEPYLERGKERNIKLDAIRKGDELYTYGDSLRIHCKNGRTYVGMLINVCLNISNGTQLIVSLRLYHDCKEFDSYAVCHTDELCLETPFDTTTVVTTEATAIEKLVVVSNEEDCCDRNHILLRKVYNHNNDSWCSLEDCLQQEKQQERRLRRQVIVEESDDEEEAGLVLNPELTILKHSVESECIPRGFVDFLAVTQDNTEDKLQFMSYLKNRYIIPAQKVGREFNPGVQLLKDLSKSGNFCIKQLENPEMVTCKLCSIVTCCDYKLILHDGTTWNLSKGCAKRLRRLNKLREFISNHKNCYSELDRNTVFNLYTELSIILKSIDSCLNPSVKDQ